MTNLEDWSKRVWVMITDILSPQAVMSQVHEWPLAVADSAEMSETESLQSQNSKY